MVRTSAKPRNVWTKVGPDAFTLAEDHEVKILTDSDGVPWRICITDGEGNAVIELSPAKWCWIQTWSELGFLMWKWKIEISVHLDVSPGDWWWVCCSHFFWNLARFLLANDLEAADATSVLWGRSFMTTFWSSPWVRGPIAWQVKGQAWPYIRLATWPLLLSWQLPTSSSQTWPQRSQGCHLRLHLP